MIERGEDTVAELLARLRGHAPEVAVLLLLTPRAYADTDAVRAEAGAIVVIDALEAAADFLIHDPPWRTFGSDYGLRHAGWHDRYQP